MTLQQILAFSVIAGTMALFVWGRLRYDLVAGVALLVAVLIGLVPAWGGSHLFPNLDGIRASTQ